MRTYSVAVASLAIDAPQKWTDNAISQHAVAGVASARRGIARRVPRTALVLLAITRELHRALGLGVRDALALAGELLDREGDGVVRRGTLSLSCDRAALERAMDARLRDALESAPTPRRGRPPRRGVRASPRPAPTRTTTP